MVGSTELSISRKIKNKFCTGAVYISFIVAQMSKKSIDWGVFYWRTRLIFGFSFSVIWRPAGVRTEPVQHQSAIPASDGEKSFGCFRRVGADFARQKRTADRCGERNMKKGDSPIWKLMAQKAHRALVLRYSAHLRMLVIIGTNYETLSADRCRWAKRTLVP